MSEEEKQAFKELKRISTITEWWFKCYYDYKDFQRYLRQILNLIQNYQKENDKLKKLITEANKIINEYANEIENDTRKIVEYRKNI